VGLPPQVCVLWQDVVAHTHLVPAHAGENRAPDTAVQPCSHRLWTAGRTVAHTEDLRGMLPEGLNMRV
jgi:hypothetical protein